jgi:lipoic acid synthetase
MLYIDTRQNLDTTCAFYFALEEYFIKEHLIEEDVFLLWSVHPTVMIGRHQVTTLEIDANYVKEHGIEVVRRNSGGGAVYTDNGCLQFSFITNKTNHKDIFRTHVTRIIDAINKLGLQATFSGRNDILLDGRKFSGNAEYMYKDKMVVHGTILFESNLEHLIGSLTPDKSKLSSHAISSVKSRVVNIGEKTNLSLSDFYDYIVGEVADHVKHLNLFPIENILTYKSKFLSDSWNIGKNPKYEFSNKTKLSSGLYTTHVSVKDNKITEIKITGDYFTLQPVEQYLENFIGVPFTRDSFIEVTKKYKVGDYFLGLKRTEFLQLFFGEKHRQKLLKPDYLKIDMNDLNKETKQIRALLKQHNLHTVCQEASCPNQMECFSHKTATFMILGTKCTRNCAFCDVTQGRPDPIDSEEPQNILKAVQIMKLKHVVITSVTRDDLKDDYGSSHFVKCIETLQEGAPETTIEVLIPDFLGHEESLMRVVDACPDVINHNVETVPRLYPGFRDRADYKRSLNVLKRVKEWNKDILTKSGIMVGIGETKEEVYTLMKDLRNVGCDILTIGQYLRPSNDHYEVKEYVSLETFDEYKQMGKELGFRFVASGPMVRSSYEAHKQFKGENQ